MDHIKITPDNKTPLYKQIVDSITASISSKSLSIGDKLPSLNAIKETYGVSRDTVLTAFNELKNKGLIDSTVGKGYYVVSTNVNLSFNIFVLFDELNGFKEDLYQSFVKHIGEVAQVDVFFHHFDELVFSDIIASNLGKYSHYVIMPANLKGIEKDIEQLSASTVYILDQTRPSLSAYSSIYQDFEKDIYEALTKLESSLKKYNKFKLVFNYKKQPLAIQQGFETFCQDKGISNQVLPDLNENLVFGNDLFLVLEDKHLILLLKIIKAKGLNIGKDCGVISYNEHMLKEVVADGITTISTDFKLMGKHLADMILAGKTEQIANISRLKLRNSI